MKNRVIEQRRRHRPEIQNVQARGYHPFEQRVVKPVGTEPAIAAQAERLCAFSNQSRSNGPPQVGHVRVQQFQCGDATNIVFAKDRRLHHLSQCATPFRSRHGGSPSSQALLHRLQLYAACKSRAEPPSLGHGTPANIIRRYRGPCMQCWPIFCESEDRRFTTKSYVLGPHFLPWRATIEAGIWRSQFQMKCSLGRILVSLT